MKDLSWQLFRLLFVSFYFVVFTVLLTIEICKGALKGYNYAEPNHLRPTLLRFSKRVLPLHPTLSTSILLPLWKNSFALMRCKVLGESSNVNILASKFKNPHHCTSKQLSFCLIVLYIVLISVVLLNWCSFGSPNTRRIAFWGKF